MTDRIDVDLARPVVYGFGAVGRAVASALVRRGLPAPLVVDDRPTDDARAVATDLGVELRARADVDLDEVLGAATVLLPSPGLGDAHEVIRRAEALDVPIRSEFDLARWWDDRPLVVITGTNGKTTVTELVTAVIERAGRRAAAVGNTPLPLVTAIDDPETELFVVEASSFRLGHTHRVEPRVAVWLNLAPDHLDAHRSFESYAAAKARLFAHLPDGATVVVPVDDPAIRALVPSSAAVETFGPGGDWHVEGERLAGPDGPVLEIARLRRRRPHDLANALAAAAVARALGIDPAAVADALAAFDGLAHRLEPVGTTGEIEWFDDSKATVPQATIAAVDGFDSVVLLAGGRNKGLDLSGLAATVPPVCHVVAFGEAGAEIEAAFAPTDVTVERVADVPAAVAAAAAVARSGDAVVLSPACTSFDAYPGYGARGDHFRQLVHALPGARPADRPCEARP